MEKCLPTRPRQAAQWNSQRDRRSAVRAADDFDLPAKGLRSGPHVIQPVPAARLRQIQSTAIIVNPQYYRISLESQPGFSLGAIRVASDIVDALLENQEDMPALVDAEAQAAIRGAEPELYIAGREHVAGKPPHALHQILQMIPAGIDGPDQIAHRADHLPRVHRDLRQRLAVPVVRAPALTQGFTDSRDLGKARAGIVAQRS